ncbi:MAG: hypothetical protein WBK33_07160, partial [Limnochordia bacterium]
MWEIGNRKAAILTTLLLALALALATTLPQLVEAQADNAPQAAAEASAEPETPDSNSITGSAVEQLTVYRRAITYPE